MGKAFGLLIGLSAMGADLALSTGGRVVRAAVPAAEIAAGVAGEWAASGARATAVGVTSVVESVVGVGRGVRDAALGRSGSGAVATRLQVPLTPRPGADSGGTDEPEAAAEELAAAVRACAGVTASRWDCDLGRLVLDISAEISIDELMALIDEHAARAGLAPAVATGEVDPDGDGAVGSTVGRGGGCGGGGADVRVGAAALALDMVAAGTAVLGRAWLRRRPPVEIAALATLLRENPRIGKALRRRLGRHTAELLLAVVNAAAHGFGQSPTALLLDAALRSVQLAEAAARRRAMRAAAEATAGRVNIVSRTVRARRRHPLADEDYAETATVTSLLAAAAALVTQRNTRQAAQALLAGSPKAARYGPAVFNAALGCALAYRDMLVPDPQQLRVLERVDTLVLHASALRTAGRIVVDVSPTAAGWSADRLWQAATEALRPTGIETTAASAESGNGRSSAATMSDKLVLRSTSDKSDGLMVASVNGRKVGTVKVGWAPDPLAEPVLGAARLGGLRVVVAGGRDLGELAVLADEVRGDETALPTVVEDLQEEGRVVLTVARCAGASGGRGDADVLAGLLASDLAVAVADRQGALIWDADVIADSGLSGVWRLLTAVSAAAAVSRESITLAKAGTTLAGLLVLTGASRRPVARLGLGVLVSPVNLAAAGALLVGMHAAVRVATARAPVPRVRLPWHALGPHEVLTYLAPGDLPSRSVVSTLSGRGRDLARAVATHPLLAPAHQSVRLAGAVRAELHDPLTPVLAVGAAASAILGSPVDALLVAGAMAMNAVIGGAQRVRAERALAGLIAGQRRRARRVTIAADVTDRFAAALTAPAVAVNAATLRPGDVIALEVGDVVPADARLLQLSNLEVDESSLTGESLPVTKQLAGTPAASLTEQHSMVFEGTTIVAGSARAVVTDTGEATRAGRAANLASRIPPPTGVQARLQELTGKALPWTVAGGALVTGLSLLRGASLRQAIGGGVAVAVAAVPEGLPLVATVAQMAAARRLSRHGVLVRSPRVLEALGRVDTVCFDKTGTLTENRLRVVRLAGANGRTCHPGDATGEMLLRAAARACPTDESDPSRHAHATDDAVLDAAPTDPRWRPLGGLPFEASRGYAAAAGTEESSGQALLVVKGAPEVVLPACPDAETGTVIESLAGDGLRVLAVAQRTLTTGEAPTVVDKPLERLELLGFLGLADTPRASSGPLVIGLRTVGVQPVMLTGDHPSTARAVAASLGWPADTIVITGDQLAAMDRAGQTAALREAGVVARVAPEQKLQVVEALRASDRVVAMVGDGANDAAAIRAADVGIGIAARGSAAARNAADLVVTGGDLSALVPAITEGRALWRSVADAVSILIGGNAGEVGFTLAGTLASGLPPLSTRQLLLVNLLTDMFPAMAVATTPSTGEPTEPPTADGADGPVGIAALGTPLAAQIRRRGLITGLGAGTAWLAGHLTPGSPRRTSTMALCGVVGAQLTQTLIGRTRSPLVLGTTLGSAAALIAIVQTPGISHFFGCTPLGPVAWSGVAAAIGTATLGSRLLPDHPTTHAAPSASQAIGPVR